VLDADGLSDGEMQALAAEFNYSETTFVLPPADPANTARVRIFNRTYEMPFAGHPNVGTAYVLARLRPELGDVLRFEEAAGLVEVRIERDAGGQVTGATIAAPQPLSLGPELPVAAVAACAGLDADAILTGAHLPRVASVGVTFVLSEVDANALGRATPSFDAFRRLLAGQPDLNGRLSILFYAHAGPGRLRARMFSPLSGTWEDPATGSANAALAAFLLSHGASDGNRFEVVQGVEMRRPSLLRIEAMRGSGGEIRARVGGGCVEVFKGEITL
jgi:trans-2,3-dihydro-3-hydroxyanthranilate isomerase